MKTCPLDLLKVRWKMEEGSRWEEIRNLEVEVTYRGRRHLFTPYFTDKATFQRLDLIQVVKDVILCCRGFYSFVRDVFSELEAFVLCADEEGQGRARQLFGYYGKLPKKKLRSFPRGNFWWMKTPTAERPRTLGPALQPAFHQGRVRPFKFGRK